MITQCQPLTGIEQVRPSWGWFLVLGIALVLLGLLALGAVWLTTIASVQMFGWFILSGGVFEAVAASCGSPLERVHSPPLGDQAGVLLVTFGRLPRT
jgi:uncharacterized membrane protein HdeD (DUF308 family)